MKCDKRSRCIIFYLHHTVLSCFDPCVDSACLHWTNPEEVLFRPGLPNLSLLSGILICSPHLQILSWFADVNCGPAVISQGLVFRKCLFGWEPVCTGTLEAFALTGASHACSDITSVHEVGSGMVGIFIAHLIRTVQIVGCGIPDIHWCKRPESAQYTVFWFWSF